MATKNAIVDYGGKLEELRSGDTLSGASGGGSINSISNVLNLNFSDEENLITTTIANTSLTNTNLRSFSYVPLETTETSLDDFSLNVVNFNIENIIDNTSFDIRGTAGNNASGTYSIRYKIIYE